ncbi:hypothetical protein PVL29_025096 [Vitis rotundifolia]|uniref:F-box/LRR-repeat protein n=1 Tax=Vitis rotundifolia TaxID=103349 RepID=A0AA39DAL1_VITRO|nr:hypothetical protein PVL29_025096 [Vitis rotundifolia]
MCFMESLLLDIPFVCKSWHKASRDPQCWDPDKPFVERLAMEYGGNLSITAFVKFIVNRSCGCATIIKCPRLKVIDVGNYNTRIDAIMPKIISKWKSLEMMRLRKFYMKEIVPQIGLHCNNFISLSAPYTNIGKDEASAIMDSLPKLKYLDLHTSYFEKETLVMILQAANSLSI